MCRLKSNKNKGFTLLNPAKQGRQSRYLTGFTLVEALVAITVLTLALGGPMTLATRSIKDSLASRNKVVAFYLAHEAIEYVKNRRDSNFLTKMATGDFPSSDWLDRIGACSSANGCKIDITGNNVSGCPPACPVMKFDGKNYTYNISDPDSIFTRTVKITNPDNTTPIAGDEIKVTVTVEWTDYGNRTVILTQNMFNLAP